MIIVTCAIIEKDGMVLCAQRSGSMHLPLKWEFPGGKKTEGESPEDCLRREIQEELGIEIGITGRLASNVHSYPGRNPFELVPFRCRIKEGSPVAREHRQIKWVRVSDLRSLDWAGADIPVVENYLREGIS
ncbi:MAG: (deoxy)nucleoside triphosphate pyrophosphohydrolase [Marinilabiliales bacterium]|nr:MAG: (deoxy)nucleoside triphosphate pyrophosphohydrolase [Marinilabiliales bacterium]